MQTTRKTVHYSNISMLYNISGQRTIFVLTKVDLAEKGGIKQDRVRPLMFMWHVTYTIKSRQRGGVLISVHRDRVVCSWIVSEP